MPGYCALSMLFSDWDRSGRRDLRVSNDRQYYPPRRARSSCGASSRARRPRLDARRRAGRSCSWGMGIASDDVTGDGYPEYYLSSMADNKLMTLVDGPERPDFRRHRPATAASARPSPPLAASRLPSTSWHPEFDDVNNDGRLDLYVAKGNVEAMPENAMKDPSELFLGRADGTFERVAKAAGILHFDRTRGAALADLNLDGLLDLVEVNRARTGPALAQRGRRDGREAQGHGPLARRGAGPAGAERGCHRRLDRGRARRDSPLVREVTIGGGHAGGQLGPVHFGLGSADEARVRVTWPDGEVGEWLDVAADQRLRIERGSDQPVVLPDPEG